MQAAFLYSDLDEVVSEKQTESLQQKEWFDDLGRMESKEVSWRYLKAIVGHCCMLDKTAEPARLGLRGQGIKGLEPFTG